MSSDAHDFHRKHDAPSGLQAGTRVAGQNTAKTTLDGRAKPHTPTGTSLLCLDETHAGMTRSEKRLEKAPR